MSAPYNWQEIAEAGCWENEKHMLVNLYYYHDLTPSQIADHLSRWTETPISSQTIIHRLKNIHKLPMKPRGGANNTKKKGT